MNTKELRIGNYVRFKHGEDEYNTVHSIDPEQIDLGIITPFGVHPEDIEGIPLTEEWLLKFWFVKTPHFTVANSITKALGSRKRKLAFGDLGTPNEILWLHENEDLVCLHNYDYDGCMHVHQLQNLYFALCGKELKIETE